MAQIHFNVFTLFPQMFEGFLSTSIIRHAHEKEIVCTHLIDFREYTTDKHRTVDDVPYGGGGGMVLKPEPLFRAVESLTDGVGSASIVLMSPQGVPFTQQKANELASCSNVFLLCGHYEGFDERIREHLVTEEISIGDYVLTGGELPAMVVMDSIIRLLPGVLGNDSSAVDDSFSTGLLEYPQYTRPAEFRGYSVPEILLSGHHGNISKWRRQESLRRTWLKRPELLEKVDLTEEDKEYLCSLQNSISDI